MLPYEIPRLATDPQVRVFPRVWKLLSFLRLPSWTDLRSYLFCLSFYLLYFFLPPFEEGNGNPLQYSCLENPMDRGAWEAAVHGVARVGHD